MDPCMLLHGCGKAFHQFPIFLFRVVDPDEVNKGDRSGPYEKRDKEPFEMLFYAACSKHSNNSAGRAAGKKKQNGRRIA